jgi:DNA-directed RNA polymerase subunit RPC12/RpoP
MSNFAFFNPGLIKEWHPIKNGVLSPQDVAPFSNKKAWWVCDNGHVWSAVIATRSKGIGCPYCSGRLPTNDKNLAVVNPLLSVQWHPTLNAPLTADQVTPISNKKAWWVCENGHEWKSSVSNRSQGKNCPYCAHQKISPEMSLLVVYPQIAKEWHPSRNGLVRPEDVFPNSNKRYWWKCQYGHEWKISPCDRNFKKCNCPYCGHQKLCKETSLASVNPELAKEWHPTKNGIITPEDIFSSSNKKVWWKCQYGHEWREKVLNRSNKRGCPYCSHHQLLKETSLAYCNPDLASEWHPTRNNSLRPENVFPNTNKKVWWLYPCGHELDAFISSRNKGVGCFLCNRPQLKYKNSLLNKFPSIAMEWDIVANGSLTTRDVSPRSRKRFWWACNNGHIFKATIDERIQGKICPKCQPY